MKLSIEHDAFMLSSHRRWFKQQQQQQQQENHTQDFLVQSLVDPVDWIPDEDRTNCNVCTRTFSTFRRKHHCRMCGEVVCSSCTLFRNTCLDTIGHTKVRVCITCIFNYTSCYPTKMSRSTASPTSDGLSPPSSNGSSNSCFSMERQQWMSTFLHSPVSKRQEEMEEQPTQEQLEEDDQISFKLEQIQVKQQSKEQLDFSWEHPWPKPPVPRNEATRLKALKSLYMMNSPPEKTFDVICELAKSRLACPMAAVSFIDTYHQWFKASTGLTHKMIPRKISFCAYVLESREPIVVLDTLKDKRFEKNPLVSGAAMIRFYASAPIFDPILNQVVGTVLVLDTRPREACDVSILERLASVVRENLPSTGPVPVHQQQIEVEEEPEQQLNVVEPQQPANEQQQEMSLTNMSQVPRMNEHLESLLMKLLTQNTETQQQLATQQIFLNQAIGQHSAQIQKLMGDFARMEERIEERMRENIQANA